MVSTKDRAKENGAYMNAAECVWVNAGYCVHDPIVCAVRIVCVLVCLCWCTLQCGRAIPMHFVLNGYDVCVHVYVCVRSTVCVASVYGTHVENSPSDEYKRSCKCVVGVTLETSFDKQTATPTSSLLLLSEFSESFRSYIQRNP